MHEACPDPQRLRYGATRLLAFSPHAAPLDGRYAPKGPGFAAARRHARPAHPGPVGLSSGPRGLGFAIRRLRLPGLPWPGWPGPTAWVVGTGATRHEPTPGSSRLEEALSRDNTRDQPQALSGGGGASRRGPGDHLSRNERNHDHCRRPHGLRTFRPAGTEVDQATQAGTVSLAAATGSRRTARTWSAEPSVPDHHIHVQTHVRPTPLTARRQLAGDPLDPPHPAAQFGQHRRLQPDPVPTSSTTSPGPTP